MPRCILLHLLKMIKKSSIRLGALYAGSSGIQIRSSVGATTESTLVGTIITDTTLLKSIPAIETTTTVKITTLVTP